MLIHIPLTKISSMISILTSIIPIILDKKNKEEIYSAAYYVSRAFTSNGEPIPELYILRKNSEIAARFKPLKYKELKSSQRGSINYTVFYLGLFFSLLFNYFLTLYMGQAIVSSHSYSFLTNRLILMKR